MEKIQYYKWNLKDFKKLKKSCQKFLDVKNCQIYQPYFSLYFHIHNTKNSSSIIDLKRDTFVKEILSIEKDKYYTSNIFLNVILKNIKDNTEYNETIFCKCIPILDQINFMMYNYSLESQNPLLPNCYSFNTTSKINDMDNTAYIDCFLSYILSELTKKDIIPTFPIYYGSLNGISNNFKYDISEEYSDFKKEKWFYRNIKKDIFTINVYESDSEYDTDSYSSSNEYNLNNKSFKSSKSSKSTNNTNSSYDSYESYESDVNDCIASLKNIPCQYLFIEKLEGTLEDLLCDIENLNIELIKSCIFQISFALSYLQKHFSFTHNDLHINNIMFKKTDKKYIYYKFCNIYFKVPTFGYLFKIIDFGRSIFTYHDKLFFNDTFNKHGEAEGQYSIPFNKLNFKEKNSYKINPNYNFDLCRLAITILDVINFDKDKDYKDKSNFVYFLYGLTIGNDKKSLFEIDDNFDMYIKIAEKSCNSLPSFTIQNYIFSNFRIKKKDFPKKIFYKF